MTNVIIGGGPQLGRADEATLVRRYQMDGDPEALRALVERMQPLVRRIARGYANRGEPLDDLVQVGCVGVLKAVGRFDVERGVRLSTFAAPTIAGEIRHHLRDRCWSVRVPRGVKELEGRLRRAADPLSVRLGRVPTAAELAEATDTTVERVLEARHGGRCHTAASLDDPGHDDHDLGAALGREDPGYAQAEHRVLLRDGLETLAAREREIVRLRFFEGLTQQEIGCRVGLSQMQISRLLRRALEELRGSLAEAGATVGAGPA